MSDYAGLIAELEAATGPDRELDEDIATAFHLTVADEPAEHYTASIDSALALVEKVLPGWDRSYAILAFGNGMFQAEIGDDGIADARTAPIAILIALLRALQSQEASDAR